MTGPDTSRCKTGFNSQNDRQSLRQSLSSNCLSFVFLIFLTSCIFNHETRDITIGSHNLHGFKTSSAYHKQCIKDYGGIWFNQEHWLTEKQIPLMKQLDSQFICRSGMEDAVSSGILRGRPFGGVGIAWSQDLDHVITPLTGYKHKRVVGVQMCTTIGKVIFMSVYMPFLDSRNREKCRTETFETMSLIGSIIEDNPHSLIVIGGDLNCELNGDSPFDILWDDFMAKYGLAYCSDQSISPGYTYHHESLGQKKLNDHFIVSRSLLSDGLCKNHRIIEDGHNPSDHLPIKMT